LSAPDLKVLRGKRVFLTGHTGFKGSWAALLLNQLGCTVAGYALPPASRPSLFVLAGVEASLAAHTIGDIRDRPALAAALNSAAPDLVLHFAAQPIVRRSYAEPAETWDTNVMGTVNLLEAVRSSPSVRALVVVTTDKCYENRGWEWGYRETDRLGGHDPYSASKAATELAVQSHRRSFFAAGGPLIASARAGNVIGGGDWGEDRILADAARAATTGTPLVLRNPAATRPWQHVLDCLSGYLTLAAALLEGNAAAADAYNFGPDQADNVTVAALLEALAEHWPQLSWTQEAVGAPHPHEAAYLYLDSSRARRTLGWRPRWPLGIAAEKTAQWYRTAIEDAGAARSMTIDQIEDYLRK
jgi:CDP-glucose 4,6-dehydratase